MENQLSFLNKRGKSTLKSHGEILKTYKNNIEKAINLDDDFPIFFDTNVLLRTYSISFKAREKLIDFYNKRKKDIYITNYIESEFIKNREDVINKFFDNVTNKIPNDFKSEVIAQIGSYVERNKIIFKDYDFFEKELIEIKSKCETLYDELLKQVESQKKENSNLIFEDKQLKILFKSNSLGPLSEVAINACKSEFNTLSKGVDIEKIGSYINKPGKVFPGVGDLKEKPDDPYGDYIIFHELMKFSKDTKKDIIFLTYDTMKGDWMRKDKKPHLHYIDNFYLNTGQLIYILDAERIFEELLDISFKSLIQIKDNEKIGNPLTMNSLSNLLSQRFSKIIPTDDDKHMEELLLELMENGYNFIDKIIYDLNRADDAFEEFIKVEEGGNNRYTRIGNLRIRLYISNPDYKNITPEHNAFILVDKTEYQPFLYLLK